MKNHEILNDQEEKVENGNEESSLNDAEVSLDENNVEDSEEVAALKHKISELENQLLRMAAENENTRRRYERMLEETKTYSISNFAKDLLGVMDNLSRALEYTLPDKNDAEIGLIYEQANGVIKGVEMTKNELETIFNKYGLESIVAIPGENFNYNLHHAVSQMVTDAYNHDSIVSNVQVGYKIKDRLLRPAMVVVAKKAEE